VIEFALGLIIGAALGLVGYQYWLKVKAQIQ
jgi:hypothetical protein